MTGKIFESLTLLVLLSTPAFGEKKIMVCEDIQNVFSDTTDERDGSPIIRLQGPPGKKGITGSQGLPGVQGLSGIPGAVDYGRISEMIEEKIQRSYCSVGAAYGGKIPDSSFTASTEHDANYAARLGRLNTPIISTWYGSWAARTPTPGQWIQVDLGNKTTVLGVKIQGRPSMDQWVTSFHLDCGLTISSMRKITSDSGEVMLFTGNTDRNTIVTNFFRAKECRYLRISPQEWRGWPSLRMDFMKNC